MKWPPPPLSLSHPLSFTTPIPLFCPHPSLLYLSSSPNRFFGTNRPLYLSLSHSCFSLPLSQSPISPWFMSIFISLLSIIHPSFPFPFPFLPPTSPILIFLPTPHDLPSLSLCVSASLSLSLSHTHTHILSLSLSLSHTHIFSLFLFSISLSHTPDSISILTFTIVLWSLYLQQNNAMKS